MEPMNFKFPPIEVARRVRHRKPYELKQAAKALADHGIKKGRKHGY